MDDGWCMDGGGDEISRHSYTSLHSPVLPLLIVYLTLHIVEHGVHGLIFSRVRCPWILREAAGRLDSFGGLLAGGIGDMLLVSI